MDANVKVLMDATGCTETEAQSVLEDAGGDVSKAMKALDTSSKEIMVFQIRFNVSGKKEAGTGFLVAMFDVSSDHVLYVDMAFPLTADQEAALDVTMPPTVFVSTLKALRNRMSDRHKAGNQSNATLIKAKFSSSFIQTAVAMHAKGNLAGVSQKFAQIINGVIGEQIEMSYFARAHSLSSLSSALGDVVQQAQLTPEQQASKLFGAKETAAAPQAAPDSDNLPAASPQEPLPRIVLITEPEISPFNGKPVRELLEGDQIIVKIKDGREAARYFAELLGGSVNDELVPLCVPVIKTNSMSETFTEVYVEFGPGIFGQFFIPPDVKIKTRNEDVELFNPFQDEESVFADKRFGLQILAGLSALILTTLVLIIVFVTMR
ncbi:MAG: hypothetical protein WCX65_04765 [bacterium]